MMDLDIECDIEANEEYLDFNNDEENKENRRACSNSPCIP
jgi:hypothetical protein